MLLALAKKKTRLGADLFEAMLAIFSAADQRYKEAWLDILGNTWNDA